MRRAVESETQKCQRRSEKRRRVTGHLRYVSSSSQNQGHGLRAVMRPSRRQRPLGTDNRSVGSVSVGSCSNASPPPPRILEEQALREYVLALFRLPRGERLHEVASCSVWTPHARCHTAGTLYNTDGYLCFSGRDEGGCILLIPLSEVRGDPRFIPPPVG